jgi:membrane protease YdiL (CAAX protease family)
MDPSVNPFMESITFACQECGKNITMPAERRGHVEICPLCGEYADVPDASEPAEVAEAVQSGSPSIGLENPISPLLLEPPARSATSLWFEVFAVLCLIYFPYQINSLIAFFQGRISERYSTLGELWRMICVLQVTVPLLLIIALTREPWSRFGIVRPRWVLDAICACFIGIFASIARLCILMLLPHSAFLAWRHVHHAGSTLPAGGAGYLLLAISLALSAFSEELAMRAYLIPRFERLLGSTFGAILLTSVLFAGYHIYQGVIPPIGDIGIGLVFGIAFCLLRRLWPLWLAHFLINLFLFIPG